MIGALSYIIAVILTLLLAICLYPVAALFWIFELIGRILVRIFDLFGKISDSMFKFTSKVIRSLWDDLKKVDKSQATADVFINQNNGPANGPINNNTDDFVQ